MVATGNAVANAVFEAYLPTVADGENQAHGLAVGRPNREDGPAMERFLRRKYEDAEWALRTEDGTVAWPPGRHNGDASQDGTHVEGSVCSTSAINNAVINEAQLKGLVSAGVDRKSEHIASSVGLESGHEVAGAFQSALVRRQLQLGSQQGSLGMSSAEALVGDQQGRRSETEEEGASGSKGSRLADVAVADLLCLEDSEAFSGGKQVTDAAHHNVMDMIDEQYVRGLISLPFATAIPGGPVSPASSYASLTATNSAGQRLSASPTPSASDFNSISYVQTPQGSVPGCLAHQNNVYIASRDNSSAGPW
ncbi:hypothetical protein CEUSTIGMA_g11395.t1 [Chlamydomonas eustigma]|uniref:Uncharacterized protein n=1 Tax=Chlamydomonas eustigma TaxID=1157962 RepID=A0A250XLJ8_9CHLO|nr:hypothetical protein CEUSTIGMA_g11395.t1 [Chlamydomonas eustigma]|eukprot:GAX83971.1 hypothetical protein CEUSTIGMA_g11395.t1 [Chlamydomonas eustigma]